MTDTEVERPCRICNKVKKWKWAADWQTNNGMCSEKCKDIYRKKDKCPLSSQSETNPLYYACILSLRSCYTVKYKDCSELIKQKLYTEYLRKKHGIQKGQLQFRRR